MRKLMFVLCIAAFVVACKKDVTNPQFSSLSGSVFVSYKRFDTIFLSPTSISSSIAYPTDTLVLNSNGSGIFKNSFGSSNFTYNLKNRTYEEADSGDVITKIIAIDTNTIELYWVEYSGQPAHDNHAEYFKKVK